MASREPSDGKPSLVGNIASLLPGPLGLAGSVISNIWSAREAAKNRAFQAEQTGTAVQRRMADLKAAGVNPLLAGRFEASSAGGSQAQISDLGDAVGKGVSSVIALRTAKAQLQLLEAQADETTARAGLARTQAADISNTAAAGRLNLISIQRDLATMDYDQRRELFPQVLAKAKAEVQSLVSSAKAAQARTALDRADLTRAENVQELYRQLESLGALGPWAKVLLELISGRNQR